MLDFCHFPSSEHTGYRFGFNGMEKDDEVKGNGNSLDFGARIYDPRIGRWLSRDPLHMKYPSFSPYSFAANSPVFFVDPDGREIHIYFVNGNGDLDHVVYTANMVAETGNDYADDAINTLNALLGAEVPIITEVITNAMNTPRVVEINYTEKATENQEYTVTWKGSTEILWSNIEGDEYSNDTKHAPSVALFDELDHFQMEATYLEKIDEAVAADDKKAKRKAIAAWKKFDKALDLEENRQFKNQQVASEGLGFGKTPGVDYYDKKGKPTGFFITDSPTSNNPAKNADERRDHYNEIDKNGQGGD